MNLIPYTSQEIKPQKHSRFYWMISDIGVFIGRSLKHIFKNTDQLLSLTLQPIMFMLLFRYVFGGAINTGTISYVNFLVAGILVQSVAFGSLTTSLSVATDLQRGIIERFKSLPTVSWGVLMGHVTADLARNILQSAIMIIVGLLVGFRPTATFIDWLMITGIILLFTFAISWVGAIIGLVSKTIEAVQWLGFFIVFPLTFASSAFAPTQDMAKVLRIFAENQPVTHVIDTVRSLMIGTPMDNHGLLAVIWCLGIIILSVPIAGYLFRKQAGK